MSAAVAQPAASNLRAKVEALDIHPGTDYSFEAVRAFRDRVLDLIDECSSDETTDVPDLGWLRATAKYGSRKDDRLEAEKLLAALERPAAVSR